MVAHVENGVHLQAKYDEVEADIVIISTESPSQDLLNNIRSIAQNNTKPVVLFSQSGDKEIVKMATRASVSAYIVGTISSERLTPVIEAAIARLEEIKQLRNELSQTKAKLDERKVIERAKGILMYQRSLDEDGAYSLLCSMAMKKSMRLVDLSNQLINTAKLLTI